MPINAKHTPTITNPSQPYNRLALRCALAVAVAGEALVPGGTLSLHATRYRKPAPGEFDVCGLVGQGEVGASLDAGENAGDDALMLALALLCRDYLGVSGDCRVDLSFAWRPVAGDVIGMATLTVTPAKGEALSDSCGNTSERAAQDPAFAQTFASLLGTIAVWADKRGW